MVDPIIGLNRPVHLARRDACVERAMELLYTPMESMSTRDRIEHVGKVIALLDIALKHASLAVRSVVAPQKEVDFRHFLTLVLRNVQSAHAFLHNQDHLESDEHSFLTQFLEVGDDEVSLSAMNYRRRSEDMLMGLWQVFRMAHAPYSKLKAANVASFAEGDRKRYELAYESSREQVTASYAVGLPLPMAPPRPLPPPGDEPVFFPEI